MYNIQIIYLEIEAACLQFKLGYPSLYKQFAENPATTFIIIFYEVNARTVAHSIRLSKYKRGLIDVNNNYQVILLGCKSLGNSSIQLSNVLTSVWLHNLPTKSIRGVVLLGAIMWLYDHCIVDRLENRLYCTSQYNQKRRNSVNFLKLYLC